MTTPSPLPSATPSIDAVHRDIAFANSYRMELTKTLLAISAALFAFTVTFGPTLKPIAWKSAMWVGWAGLAVSMMGGIVHLLGWDHYYKSYLDVDWRRRNEPDQAAVRAAGKAARNMINRWRRMGMAAQFGGFFIGVAGVGVFAGANIENGAPKADAGAAPAQYSCQCNSPMAMPARPAGSSVGGAAPPGASAASAASAGVGR